MQQQLNQLLTDGLREIQSAQDENTLRQVEIKYLGRKGPLTDILKQLKDLTPDQKREMGQLGNEVKQRLVLEVENKSKQLENAKFGSLAQTEWQDPTQTGTRVECGRIHPITAFLAEVREVFTALGFEFADGPELEDDFHNFEALNIPADHPARDGQDTFFLRNFPQNLLRTQTSAMQIRWCETHQPPIRIIAPGKCFRKDELDATHSPIFHQFEGLIIDENVSFAHLRGVISEAFRQLLGKDTKFRFRTSYFPFVEPGAEVDVTCSLCGGKGCRVCKGVGWIEMLGCGMVHPNVLKAMGYDPDKYTGLAFGAGIERMLMIRHQIPDIRYFYENDLRFLKQF